MLSKCRRYTPEPRFQTTNRETWIRAIVGYFCLVSLNIRLSFSQVDDQPLVTLDRKFSIRINLSYVMTLSFVQQILLV